MTSDTLQPHANASAIEYLDFTHVQQCEQPSHMAKHEDQPARYLVTATCPGCGKGGARWFICAFGWGLAGAVGARCPRCGLHSARDDCARILRVIGTGS